MSRLPFRVPSPWPRAGLSLSCLLFLVVAPAGGQTRSPAVDRMVEDVAKGWCESIDPKNPDTVDAARDYVRDLRRDAATDLEKAWAERSAPEQQKKLAAARKDFDEAFKRAQNDATRPQRTAVEAAAKRGDEALKAHVVALAAFTDVQREQLAFLKQQGLGKIEDAAARFQAAEMVLRVKGVERAELQAKLDGCLSRWFGKGTALAKAQLEDCKTEIDQATERQKNARAEISAALQGLGRDPLPDDAGEPQVAAAIAQMQGDQAKAERASKAVTTAKEELTAAGEELKKAKRALLAAEKTFVPSPMVVLGLATRYQALQEADKAWLDAKLFARAAQDTSRKVEKCIADKAALMSGAGEKAAAVSGTWECKGTFTHRDGRTTPLGNQGTLEGEVHVYQPAADPAGAFAELRLVMRDTSGDEKTIPATVTPTARDAAGKVTRSTVAWTYRDEFGGVSIRHDARGFLDGDPFAPGKLTGKGVWDTTVQGDIDGTMSPVHGTWEAH